MLPTTLLQRSALVVVLGTSAAASRTSHHKTQVINYHLKLTGRDSSGAYDWEGSVDGFVTGHATVTLRPQDAPPKPPGAFPIETHWHVQAAAANTDVLEATLSGVLTLPSGKTHLVGAIIRGAGRGQEVETRSQITNFGVAGAVSNCDGTITISPPVVPSTSP